MKKKGAVEMSVGTMVVIALAVTMLILSIFLIKNIFSSAKGVVELTDEQLRNEINQLFSSEDKISIYPSTRYVEIKQENTDGVGIGIKNLLTGTSGDTTFSYEIVVSDGSDCGISDEEISSWIVGSGKEEDIPIASGDLLSDKILFRIPVGAPLCIVKFRVNVYYGSGKTYATDSFNIEVKAK